MRRVKAEEWQRLKELWLEASRDPIAHLAFLESIEDALERPESSWRERAETAAGGATVAQFVAVAEPDDVAGLARRAGEPYELRGLRPVVRVGCSLSQSCSGAHRCRAKR